MLDIQFSIDKKKYRVICVLGNKLKKVMTDFIFTNKGALKESIAKVNKDCDFFDEDELIKIYKKVLDDKKRKNTK